jgi:hypothetical protein
MVKRKAMRTRDKGIGAIATLNLVGIERSQPPFAKIFCNSEKMPGSSDMVKTSTHLSQ